MPCNVRCAVLLLLIVVIAGCGSSKRYVDEPHMNMQVIAKISAGEFLSSASGSVDVFRVDHACRQEYLGSKAIGGKPVEFGLAAGQRVNLVFHFRESSFLENRSRSNAMSAMVTPRAHAYYIVEASYDGTLQDLHMYKQIGNGRKEMRLKQIMDCSPR